MNHEPTHSKTFTLHAPRAAMGVPPQVIAADTSVAQFVATMPLSKA